MILSTIISSGLTEGKGNVLVRNTPHAASYFGKKVVIDGLKFDSMKEASFYKLYLKPSGYQFTTQERFTLLETFPLELVKLRQTVYKSDFVVYDKNGSIKHVYDVKNGYTEYAIDQKSKIKFSLFARKYGIPVEVVVMRKNYFNVTILGTTKKVSPVPMVNIDYDWQDIIR